LLCFQRVECAPGASARLTFRLPAGRLGLSGADLRQSERADANELRDDAGVIPGTGAAGPLRRRAPTRSAGGRSHAPPAAWTPWAGSPEMGGRLPITDRIFSYQ
jgi:hypothetical protein